MWTLIPEIQKLSVTSGGHKTLKDWCACTRQLSSAFTWALVHDERGLKFLIAQDMLCRQTCQPTGRVWKGHTSSAHYKWKTGSPHTVGPSSSHLDCQCQQRSSLAAQQSASFPSTPQVHKTWKILGTQIHSGGLTASESRVAHPSCMKSPVQQSVEVSGLSTGQICENTTQSVWIYSRLWAILLKCHLLHQWQQMCAHLNSHFLTRFRISLCQIW